MKEKTLTCIGCPLGCTLQVEMEGSQVAQVTGNTCPRGEAYAKKELTHPTRILTTTLPVEGGALPMVSVKTAGEVPKEAVFDCVKALRGLTAQAPITIGQRLVENLAGTGVDVIATKSVPAK